MARALARGGLLALILSWALAAQGLMANEYHDYVAPGSQAAELAACVEPTERMRRKHMEFIKHQRDATVHQGIRGTKYSLSGCVACHVSYDAQQKPRPINAPDQFCGACHAYAAVDLNCFDCHAAVPSQRADHPRAQAAHRAAGVERLVQAVGDGRGH